MTNNPSIFTSGAKAMSHAVAVVPMFEPMITLIACVRFRRPEDTNPTTITVMIDDDWTITVETMPVPTPAKRCVVASDMNRLRPDPLTACSPSERCFMPSRNVPSPPPTTTSIDNSSFMATSLLICVPSASSKGIARRPWRCLCRLQFFLGSLDSLPVLSSFVFACKYIQYVSASNEASVRFLSDGLMDFLTQS